MSRLLPYLFSTLHHIYQLFMANTHPQLFAIYIEPPDGPDTGSGGLESLSYRSAYCFYVNNTGAHELVLSRIDYCKMVQGVRHEFVLTHLASPLGAVGLIIWERQGFHPRNEKTDDLPSPAPAPAPSPSPSPSPLFTSNAPARLSEMLDGLKGTELAIDRAVCIDGISTSPFRLAPYDVLASVTPSPPIAFHKALAAFKVVSRSKPYYDTRLANCYVFGLTFFRLL
ncbi:hypothetical protein BD309DRAFT_1024516, partial [Dichomitus squalens]